MAYGLDQFISDCPFHSLSAMADRTAARGCAVQLERLLQNPDFIREHASESTPRGTARALRGSRSRLSDPRPHQRQSAVSPPHDHGESWAIYGQATHHNRHDRMGSEDDAGDADHAKLKPVKKYR